MVPLFRISAEKHKSPKFVPLAGHPNDQEIESTSSILASTDVKMVHLVIPLEYFLIYVCQKK